MPPFGCDPRRHPDLMAGKSLMLPDQPRLTILRTLMVGVEMSVCQVVERTGRESANVSKHLKRPAGDGVVARRKDGLQVFCGLDDPVVEKMCRLVCDSIYQDMEGEMERQRKSLRGKHR